MSRPAAGRDIRDHHMVDYAGALQSGSKNRTQRSGEHFANRVIELVNGPIMLTNAQGFGGRAHSRRAATTATAVAGQCEWTDEDAIRTAFNAEARDLTMRRCARERGAANGIAAAEYANDQIGAGR